jgi:hypothetical protein
VDASYNGTDGLIVSAKSFADGLKRASFKWLNSGSNEAACTAYYTQAWVGNDVTSSYVSGGKLAMQEPSAPSAWRRARRSTSGPTSAP